MHRYPVRGTEGGSVMLPESSWSSSPPTLAGLHRGCSGIRRLLPRLVATVLASFAIAPVAHADVRATSDRADDLPGHAQAHVLYVLPSNGADHSLDTNGAIAASVDSWQRWLQSQAG